MKISEKREKLIDEMARRPFGVKGRKRYNEPRKRYRSYEVILDMLKLRADDRYLEIGCGGGLLLRMALEKAGIAAGLDHSPDMVELSKENNARDVETGRADIVPGDAAALPWENSRFTAVASANMFFFVEEPETALGEIYRVLKPGGRFAMVTMDNRIIGKITFGWLYKLRTYSIRRMRTMFENAGFISIEIKNKLPFSQICYAEKGV
jgi:ubiquinone/menaquinone biosynthesis C-methylase UbiE